jgi:predicted amidohydrolase
MRIAFLHIAPLPGEVEHNQRLIEAGITIAAQAGAHLVLTPELATTGYGFNDRIGTNWITTQPDTWVRGICDLARGHQTAVLLGHVERDEVHGRLHNSLFAISAAGELLGRHRKVHTLRVGSEAWSTPGCGATVLDLLPNVKAGLLICADACSIELPRQMKMSGATILLSAAAWAPGPHGPNGEWEQITRQVGLPLFVCNRTGNDVLSFVNAESVIDYRGSRLMSMTSAQSTVFVVDWNVEQESLETDQPLTFDIPSGPPSGLASCQLNMLRSGGTGVTV